MKYICLTFCSRLLHSFPVFNLEKADFFLPSPSSVHLHRRKRRRGREKRSFSPPVLSPLPLLPLLEAIQQTIGRQEYSHHHPPPPPPPFNKRKEDLQPLLQWYSFLYALGKGGGGFFSPLPPPPPSPPLSGSERGKEEKTASLSLPPFFRKVAPSVSRLQQETNSLWLFAGKKLCLSHLIWCFLHRRILFS